VLTVDKSAPGAQYYTVVAGDTGRRSRSSSTAPEQVREDFETDKPMPSNPDRI